MEDQKINVAVESGVQKLVILNGEATKPLNKKGLKIHGNIKAPAAWHKVRKASPLEAFVQYSRADMQITLIENESVPELQNVITGSLKLDSDLQKFGINNNKIWSTSDLAQHLKMNRLFFEDREKAMIIVNELNKLRARVSTELEKDKDERGNKRALVDTKVSSNVPEQFVLMMPVFVGFPPKKFMVDICMSSTDVGVQLWLESPELNEIVLGERDSIIEDQLAHLAPLPIIEY